MGFNIETTISTATVFLQGLLSFFSPCVLPLIPLYMSYLSGGAKSVDDEGIIHYKRKAVMLHTIFFVLGISFAFFTLGISVTVFGQFITKNRLILSRIGGILVFLFGLYQLGIFGTSKIIGQEKRLPFRLNLLTMNPITALVLGFVFSFAWTPCVGPALASVLLMAASAASSGTGLVLIGVYTIGFILPFLLVGLFTGTLLELLKKHRNIVAYTVKFGGVLMIFMGIMMFTGWMNNITGYLSQFGAIEQESETAKVPAAPSEEPLPSDQSEDEDEIVLAPDFTLTDQFGNTHTLSDYQGKTILLNFWATWCPPCRNEMPDIQAIYEEYGYNEEDLIILGIAGPNIGQEGSAEDIAAFLADNEYTYPTVMNEDGTLFLNYNITAYPTTFMISEDGAIFGYAQGQLSKDILYSIIRQTMELKITE